MGQDDTAEPGLSPPVALSAEATQRIINESVLELWDVVNNLTLLRPPRTQRYHATIFGSARIQPHTPTYDEVRRLARELATLGCAIVTGGGPGLMQAANEGAVEANPDRASSSVGIRVDLSFEQNTNAFVGQLYEHKTFFTRLHHFALLSNVFVVVQGGIGTALELLMIWQLLQVRKLYDTPLILVGKMWSELVVWARRYMTETQPQLASPIDMTIPRCVDTMDEAIALIRDHHAEWVKRGLN
jgi:uncharacterized protein (TIGR00730 family)